MRQISFQEIEKAVYDIFLKANYDISPSVETTIRSYKNKEITNTAVNILEQIEENYKIAKDDRVAICQDCGMAIVFAKVGQDVHIDGDFEEAIQSGVRRAYDEGYLRKSVVDDPLFDRKNTSDNTPAIIYTRLVKGDNIELTAVAKGFGSENCSKLRMFVPSNTVEDIKEFIVDTVKEAGPNTCPPSIVGIGIGGTMEKAALMAKEATARDIATKNPEPRYAKLEEELLEAINDTGIGPAGFGGLTTCIGVNIEYHPTHIAGLPVAVNMCCHASRHASTII